MRFARNTVTVLKVARELKELGVGIFVQRRKEYLEEHGTNSYSHRPETNPFASRIVCGAVIRCLPERAGGSSTGVDRKIWQCSERYKVRVIMGCGNRHVEETTLEKAYVMAWNSILENREDFIAK
ncbi:hypothetical protein [Clostridium sp. E02]|uniref:hypothetical protein n=1 Tax=Clostridium sp. E02 TaxID=2487134 RepID=UPI00325B4885